MLEKPDIPDALIQSRLVEEYGLRDPGITFLPLGADQDTSVYRVDTPDRIAYFLKLRSGPFDELQVLIPRILAAQGMQALIAPLATRRGGLWGELDGSRLSPNLSSKISAKMVLFPFVEGKDGYEATLSEQQWILFGAAMKAIHAAQVPEALRKRIPPETFSEHWREKVKAFQIRVEEECFPEPLAERLAAFMHVQRAEISRLVERASRLADGLRRDPPEMVLCHADIHPGNLLIGAQGELFIVDWDTLAIAPKERDLMFGGEEGSREAELFARGYGRVEIERSALAYYHAARILEDLAVICEQLFLSSVGGDDREQAYGYFVSNFQPGNTIEIADRAYARCGL